MGIRIIGTGSYLPPKVVTNDDLAKTLDTSDEWIYSHTGIHSRHIAGPEENTSSMAVQAAIKALEAAKVPAEKIGAVILATSTPDYNPFPSTSCIIQEKLGCVNAAAWDLSAACTGFIYALEAARGYLALHPGRPVLVIGAETLSRAVDWNDRGTCILFGDGAGAMVVEHVPGDDPNWITHLRADGSGAEFITRDGGARIPADSPEMKAPYLVMNGRQVFNFAVKTLDAVARNLCAEGNTAPDKIDRIFAHQANGRIIEAVARRMEMPLEKFYMNLDQTGNTSAASIPVAIDNAVRAGELKDGMTIAMIGFGAGLTFGGTLLKWPGLVK